MDLLLRNIGLLATPVGNEVQKGKRQGEITLIKNAAIGVTDGKITYVGPDDAANCARNEIDCDIHARPAQNVINNARNETDYNVHDKLTQGVFNNAYEIDCSGKLVTPGLVDAHTHLVFGGWREDEMALRLAGASYADILKQGGGILSTVRRTRAASDSELADKTSEALREMLRHGTTTVECKSGYGLNVADELKQLRVVKTLQQSQPVTLVPTFMGAHAIPGEFVNDRAGYVKLLCDEMLPAVADAGLAEYCDIFIEDAAFTAEEAARILTRAKGLGLKQKAHVDELRAGGGAELAAAAGCVSAEHLIYASDRGIGEMADHNVTAVLLPATSFYLDKPYARARDMIECGVAVAVATDFNPGSSPNLNLQFPMALACLRYKLTPAESLTAVTLNAAAAIGRAGSIGTLEVGKDADIVVWDAPNLDYIFYRYGSNLAHTVIKSGKIYPVKD